MRSEAPSTTKSAWTSSATETSVDAGEEPSVTRVRESTPISAPRARADSISEAVTCRADSLAPSPNTRLAKPELAPSPNTLLTSPDLPPSSPNTLLTSLLWTSLSGTTRISGRWRCTT